MNSRFERMIVAFRSAGLKRIIFGIKIRIQRRVRRRKWNKILDISNPKDKFTKIYTNKMWKGSESASGFGSGKLYTESLRESLPNLIKKFEIESVFDAGCGDFNWMKYVLQVVDVDYTGADIVDILIKKNNKRYANKKTKFLNLDAKSSVIPQVDLVICRDLLFHLSIAEVNMTLVNLIDSRSKYYLLTSHLDSGDYLNVDIKTGDFRRLDLLAEPFNLPAPSLYRIQDWIFPDPPRMMYLYSYKELYDWAQRRS